MEYEFQKSVREALKLCLVLDRKESNLPFVIQLLKSCACICVSSTRVCFGNEVVRLHLLIEGFSLDSNLIVHKCYLGLARDLTFPRTNTAFVGIS